GRAALLLWVGRVSTGRPLRWALLLAWLFPYVATTGGWVSGELGRQPWLVYGLQRTLHGTSPELSGGNVAFTALGFMWLYLVVGVLYLYLVGREIGRGPAPVPAGAAEGQGQPQAVELPAPVGV